MFFNILFSHIMKINLKLKFENELLKTFRVYSKIVIDIVRTPYNLFLEWYFLILFPLLPVFSIKLSL